MTKIESYTCIAVVPDGKERKGLKYHTPDLLDFQRFLDRTHANWLWFNVFDKAGVQIASYTKNKRAITKRVEK